MTRVKLLKMEKNEIETLVKEQFLCRIAFRGDFHPYIAPFQYIVINGSLYFHFTNYGQKMNFFRQGTPVCVEIETYTPNLSTYQFVVFIGRLKLVEDFEERKKAIKKMAEVGKEKLSTNFLVAHGFPLGSTWDILTPEKHLLILKLEEITDIIGLRSP